MSSFWNGRRVMITGHTGFKGAWLAFWLSQLGAKLSGFALAPNSEPNLHDLLNISDCGNFIIADLMDTQKISALIKHEKPEILIHMAAQALVKASYTDPVETFRANSLGTAHILDIARTSPSLRSLLVVTTDKVYRNEGYTIPFNETDPLGGADPYSASKACAELISASYRQSFFNKDTSAARLATVRAGNVVGGGDWSQDRIIPDLVRGCLSDTGRVTIRNPHAVRPWQHVFDVLNAYLLISEKLYHHEAGVDAAWNIGPNESGTITVDDLAKRFLSAFGRGTIDYKPVADAHHEAHHLALDSSQARTKLDWKSRFSLDDTLRLTTDWYQAWHAGHDMREVSQHQLAEFMRLT